MPEGQYKLLFHRPHWATSGTKLMIHQPLILCSAKKLMKKKKKKGTSISSNRLLCTLGCFRIKLKHEFSKDKHSALKSQFCKLICAAQDKGGCPHVSACSIKAIFVHLEQWGMWLVNTTHNKHNKIRPWLISSRLCFCSFQVNASKIHGMKSFISQSSPRSALSFPFKLLQLLALSLNTHANLL